MSVNCKHDKCRNSFECKAIKGSRVELHPATDRWMMGDRYGVVTRELQFNMLRITLDKSGETFTYKRDDILNPISD